MLTEVHLTLLWTLNQIDDVHWNYLREISLSWSAAANIRRLADCQLGHGPDPGLGGRKRNSFLIRGARDFAWFCHPTSSLVFNIWACNIKASVKRHEFHYGPKSCTRTNVGHRRTEKLLMQFTNSLEPCFLTNYLIACCRQFICAAPMRRQHCVLVTVAWAIIPLGLGKQVGGDLLWTRHRVLWCECNLPNVFGFSSLMNELSPSSSSDTSTSSSCKPFFGSQVILFSFFNRLLALANQQLT